MQEETAVPPPRWAGVVAGVLVALMVVAFVVPIPFALWPITSWELFSRVRAAEQATYRVEVVATDGTTKPLPFSRLGETHQRWIAIARTFPSMELEDRREVCRTWAEAAVELLGPDEVHQVQVHRVVQRAAAGGTDPPVAVSRHLVVECTPA